LLKTAIKCCLKYARPVQRNYIFLFFIMLLAEKEKKNDVKKDISVLDVVSLIDNNYVSVTFTYCSFNNKKRTNFEYGPTYVTYLKGKKDNNEEIIFWNDVGDARVRVFGFQWSIIRANASSTSDNSFCLSSKHNGPNDDSAEEIHYRGKNQECYQLVRNRLPDKLE